MTRPSVPPDPPPIVRLEPSLRTGAGSPLDATVVVTNIAGAPRLMAVSALGVDTAWTRGTVVYGPLAAGESRRLPITLTPPIGTMPARYPLAISVQAIDANTNTVVGQPVVADTTLVIDAPGDITIGLERAELTAVVSHRFTVIVANVGHTAARVQLDAQSPSSIHVRLKRHEVVIPAGRTMRISGRAQIVRPRASGQQSRHAFTVTARTAGAPQHTSGVLIGRTALGANGPKLAILATVLALWAAAALVFIPKLADEVRKRNLAGQGSSTAPTAPTSPGTGSGGTGGSGGSGGKNGGGSGAGGVGTPGGSEQVAGGPTSVQLNGTVTGIKPDGVTAHLEPTSLFAADAVGARRVGTFADEPREIGKVYSAAVALTAPSSGTQPSSVVLQASGAWSFPGIKAPGYYLLTFSKPGYQTARYIVDSSTVASTQPLEVPMSPGEGRLSGTVHGPSGLVGGATVTITDGVNTLTTSSNSKGTVGSWAIGGASTPSTYLVLVSRPGLGAESKLVTLGAGGTASVDLTLRAGVGGLVGSVSGRAPGGTPSLLGGVTVTATDGTTTRTTTTLTRTPVGSYTLPDLPVPGTYTVTFSAPGFLSQTQRISFAAGQSVARMGAVLNESGAVIRGVVMGDRVDSDGQKVGTTLEPKVDAGLTLASADNTYKITTANDGSYTLRGVIPGTYVLSAQYPGLETNHLTITADTQKPVTANFELHVPPAAANKASIIGYVGSATTPGNTLLCTSVPADQCVITFRLVDADGVEKKDIDTGTGTNTKPAATSGPTAYTIVAKSGLTPGVYRLTARAPGYLPATVTVQVPLNAAASAPQMNLFPTNTLQGTLVALGELSTDGPNPPYKNCVFMVPSGSSTTNLTTCDPGLVPASPCAVNGQAGPAYSEIAAGNKYALRDLCDGTYVFHVVITNPDYIAPTDVLQTLGRGQTLDYSPHIVRKGRVLLTVFRNADGVLSPAPDALQVSGTCTNSDQVSTTLTDGQVIVTGVTEGTVDCTLSTADGYTGKTTGIRVVNDNDTFRNITLTKAVGAFFGKVRSQWGTATGTAVSGATVRVTGVTGYNGTTPTTSTVEVVTNSNGCYAFVPSAQASYATGDPLCATITSGIGVLPVVSTSVTVTVTPLPGSGYSATSGTQLVVASGQLPQVNLIPQRATNLSALRVGLTTVSGAAPPLTAVRIAVNKSRAFGAGTVTVTVNPDGSFKWLDTNYDGLEGAWPGGYTLTASLDGYESVSRDVTCTIAGSCTFDGGLTLTLAQLGALSGSVTGVLGVDTGGTPTDPEQSLAGTQVRITPCTPDSVSLPTTCTDVTGAAAITATTGLDGRFALSISPSTSPYVLAPGFYNVAFSSFGFKPVTKFISIASGDNTISARLFVELTAVNIGVVTAATPHTPPLTSELTKDVTVTLTRLDTGASISLAAGDNQTRLYFFDNLVPTSYLVRIEGATVQTTTQVISLPYIAPGTAPKTFYIRTGVAQASINGFVTGLQGAGEIPSPMNGATVEVGTVGANGQFSVSKNIDGAPMTTVTAASGGGDGGYSFAGVPPSTYTLRYSKTGYLTATGPQLTINSGDVRSLAPVTLTRVSNDVVFTLTATSSNDDLSGTVVTLAPKVAGSNPTIAPYTEPAAAPNATVQHTFSQVPFGDWTLTFTLPAAHFGPITPTTGLTCSLFQASPSAINQTQCVRDVTVSTTSGTPSTLTYSIDEARLDVALTEKALTGQTPPTVHLTITPVGQTRALYDNADFPATTSATVVWLPTSGSFTVKAVGTGSNADPAKWPDVTRTVTGLSTTATKSLIIAFNQIVSLTVTVVGAGAGTTNQAALTLTAPSNQVVPAAYAAGVTTTGGTFTFTLPLGTWTVAAELSSPKKTDSASVTLTDATNSLTLTPK